MKYNFQTTLDRQFAQQIVRLHDKYGTDMMKIEGLAPEQLDACNSIRNFLNGDTVADSTIDDNANVRTKNVQTMLNEAYKPMSKLLSKNKIYIEMKENFGKEVADMYLESCVNGEIYEHDSHRTSFEPYSYFGEETILVKYKGILNYLSFKKLYDLIDENVVLINEKDKAFGKYTNDLEIWDKDKWTKVIRVIQKPKNTDFVFVKGSNGVSQIVTTNHPVITTSGNKRADEVTLDDKIITALPNVAIGNVKSIYLLEELKELNPLFNGEQISEKTKIKDSGQVSLYNKQTCMQNIIELDSDLGWLYGMILADGHLTDNGVGISQNDGDILEHIKKILNKKNLPYGISNKENKKCKTLVIRSLLFKNLLQHTFDYVNGSKNKRLPSDFLKYNKEFLKGIIGGLLDGDGTLMLKTNRRINIRIISRELLNQISFLIQLFGYNVRDGKPLKPRDESRGFKSKNILYQISFTPQKNQEHFYSMKIKNNVDSYLDKKDAEKYCNKKYSFGYGETNVINAETIEINEEYVYDISTETHTFMCNNIVSHNCFAFSIEKIVENGLFFIEDMKAEAPKHWDTFNHHILEFIAYATNSQSKKHWTLI